MSKSSQSRLKIFMNPDAPCPEDIPGCDQLRKNYLNEMNPKGGGCSKCRANAVRKKYGKLIATAITKSNE